MSTSPHSKASAAQASYQANKLRIRSSRLYIQRAKRGAELLRDYLRYCRPYNPKVRPPSKVEVKAFLHDMLDTWVIEDRRGRRKAPVEEILADDKAPTTSLPY